MDRSASAVWNGSLKEGKGTISSQSGALKAMQYSFAARFAEGVGTNPEELIAAAHAGCFSMALSAELGKAGFTPDSIETTAVVTLDLHDKPTVTKIHLTTKAKIPGIDKAKFDEIADGREGGLPDLAAAGGGGDYAGRDAGVVPPPPGGGWYQLNRLFSTTCLFYPPVNISI